MYVRNAWYVAAWAGNIENAIQHMTIMDEPILLYRTESGQVVALEDRCCHRRVPLHLGKLVGDIVQCGYHGFMFDQHGTCVGIPNQEQVPPTAKVKSYPARERYHLVWIWMGDPSLADESSIPDFSVLDDPLHAWKGTYMHAKANYRLITDNLTDLSHLTFVHGTTIGTKYTALADITIEASDDHVTQTRWMIDTPSPPTYQRLAGFKDNIDRWQVVTFMPPACVVLRTGGRAVSTGARNWEANDGIGLYALNAVTPETNSTSHYFWAQTHDFRIDQPQITEALFNDIDTAFHQDLEIFASQQEWIEHNPDAMEINCRADKPQLLGRKLVDRLLQQENAI